MSSTFAELYEKSLLNLKEGEVVKGTVIDIQNRDVIVDIEDTSGTALPVLIFQKTINLPCSDWH